MKCPKGHRMHQMGFHAKDAKDGKTKFYGVMEGRVYFYCPECAKVYKFALPG